LVRAFAERLTPALAYARKEASAAVPVLFTAHSVPCRTICGQDHDPYSIQAKQTAALVAQQCGLSESDWYFAFQSQGMSGGPWIGPTVEDTVAGLKTLGHTGLLMQPIGFVCDHVEVLFDIDIFFKKFADERGIRLWRAESLNTSPLFITALADLARKALPQFATSADRRQ
jgi:ferrochelatase